MRYLFLFGPAAVALLCQLTITITTLLWPQLKSIGLTIEFVNNLTIIQIIAIFLMPLSIVICLFMFFWGTSKRHLAIKAIFLNGLAILCAFSTDLFPGLMDYIDNLPSEKAYLADCARSSLEDYTKCKLTNNFTSIESSRLNQPTCEDDIWIRCSYLDDTKMLEWLDSYGWKRRELQSDYDFSYNGQPAWWPKNETNIVSFEKKIGTSKILSALLTTVHKVLYIHIDIR
jgi:hypothetical protein